MLFEEAQLKSERLRIRIVLGVVGAAILLRVLRTLVVGVMRMLRGS